MTAPDHERIRQDLIEARRLVARVEEAYLALDDEQDGNPDRSRHRVLFRRHGAATAIVEQLGWLLDAHEGDAP